MIRLSWRELKCLDEPPVILGQSPLRNFVRPYETTEAAPAIAHVWDALVGNKKVDHALREARIHVIVTPLKKTAATARAARLTSRGTDAAGDDEARAARHAALPEWQ